MKKGFPALLLLATPLLFFSAQAYGQSQACDEDMAWMTLDTASAAKDCGEWAESQFKDPIKAAMCTADMIMLGKDLVDYNRDCGPDGRHGPADCAWWDLWCSATNVWNNRGGPGDWDFGGGGFGWWPKWMKPDDEQTVNLKMCADQLRLTRDLTAYADCTAKSKGGVD